MAVFGPIPLQAGFTSMGELADLMMKKRQMQQEAELKKYEIEQMAPYKTALMNYQNALTASLPMRYLTPQGKALNEQSNIMQGGSPIGTPQGQPIVPGSMPYYDPTRLQDTGQPQSPSNERSTSANEYRLKRTKENVPASVLSKDLYATNIDKTLDPKIGINVDDLTQYNNPIGQLKLKQQEALDLAGLPTTPEYQRYKESEGKFDFLANQIRQFYGDSIQPSAMAEKIKKLDPRSGYKSAKISKARFASQKKLLERELQTYRDATKSPDVYKGGNAINENEVEGQAAPEGNVWMITPEGEKVPVHRSNVNHASKEYGFKLVE